MKSSGDLINNKNTTTYPWRNLGEEKARTGFRPSWGKTRENLRFRSVISMRIMQFVKKKAPNPPARGLKYEILAFIQTKNVEKLKITSKKRHRTAYLPEQSS